MISHKISQDSVTRHTSRLKAESGGGNVTSWEISHGLDIIHASSTSVSVSRVVDQRVTSYHSQMTPSWSLRPSRKEYKKRIISDEIYIRKYFLK